MDALLTDLQRTFDLVFPGHDDVRRQADDLPHEVAERVRKEVERKKDLSDALSNQGDLRKAHGRGRVIQTCGQACV